MSVLIKGMAMPQNCRECRFMETVRRLDGRERYICIAHLNEITNLKERLDTCPLDDPPGIDPEKFVEDYCRSIKTKTVGEVLSEVCEVPPKVIIPAERSEASLCDNCDEKNENCSWCKRMERSEE